MTKNTNGGLIYVAIVSTADEIIAVANNADDAVIYACRKALSYLRSRHAVSSLTIYAEYVGRQLMEVVR